MRPIHYCYWTWTTFSWCAKRDPFAAISGIVPHMLQVPWPILSEDFWSDNATVSCEAGPPTSVERALAQLRRPARYRVVDVDYVITGAGTQELKNNFFTLASDYGYGTVSEAWKVKLARGGEVVRRTWLAPTKLLPMGTVEYERVSL